MEWMYKITAEGTSYSGEDAEALWARWQKEKKGSDPLLALYNRMVSYFEGLMNAVSDGDEEASLEEVLTVTGNSIEKTGDAYDAVYGTILPLYSSQVALSKEEYFSAFFLMLLEANPGGKGVNKADKGLWKLTEEAASQIKLHIDFGKFFKSKSDKLWWSVDKLGHCGSKFKVFKETKKGLEWVFDADEYGDKIINKHKEPTGEFIPWDSKFKTIKNE